MLSFGLLQVVRSRIGLLLDHVDRLIELARTIVLHQTEHGEQQQQKRYDRLQIERPALGHPETAKVVDRYEVSRAQLLLAYRDEDHHEHRQNGRYGGDRQLECARVPRHRTRRAVRTVLLFLLHDGEREVDQDGECGHYGEHTGQTEERRSAKHRVDHVAELSTIAAVESQHWTGLVVADQPQTEMAALQRNAWVGEGKV